MRTFDHQEHINRDSICVWSDGSWCEADDLDLYPDRGACLVYISACGVRPEDTDYFALCVARDNQDCDSDAEYEREEARRAEFRADFPDCDDCDDDDFDDDDDDSEF